MWNIALTPCRYADIIALSTFKDKLKNFLLLTVVVLGFSGTAKAEDFTNKDFLTLAEAHQKFWIEGAVDALAQVAAAKDKQTGKCVVDWYYTQRAETNSLILASMEKYSDAYPSVIMVALAERACGEFRK